MIIRNVTHHKIISHHITSCHAISCYHNVCYFFSSIIVTANDMNTSTLVVSSQLSDAYNAPTGELESFLHGTSLHRCNKKMKEVSTVNLNKTNQAMSDISSTDEDSTRCLSLSSQHAHLHYTIPMLLSYQWFVIHFAFAHFLLLTFYYSFTHHCMLLFKAPASVIHCFKNILNFIYFYDYLCFKYISSLQFSSCV